MRSKIQDQQEKSTYINLSSLCWRSDEATPPIPTLSLLSLCVLAWQMSDSVKPCWFFRFATLRSCRRFDLHGSYEKISWFNVEQQRYPAPLFLSDPGFFCWLPWLTTQDRPSSCPRIPPAKGNKNNRVRTD